MYTNPYITAYNPQADVDRLNAQINDLERMKKQIQHPQQVPTNLTQNFQLAPPNRDTIRYAESIEEVKRDMVLGETPYFSKDMSVVWVKNTKGEIKTYELTQIVEKDEKDIKIEYLMAQIEELKRGRRYESDANANGNITEPNKNEEPASIPTITKPNKKNK
jgi:hypothetical protein